MVERNGGDAPGSLDFGQIVEESFQDDEFVAARISLLAEESRNKGYFNLRSLALRSQDPILVTILPEEQDPSKLGQIRIVEFSVVDMATGAVEVHDENLPELNQNGAFSWVGLRLNFGQIPVSDAGKFKSLMLQPNIIGPGRNGEKMCIAVDAAGDNFRDVRDTHFLRSRIGEIFVHGVQIL